ncbi:MAG: sporulation protein [Oscillospiraceae bacterium]|nr:sporulation protein [Oscillospiraceae bacterium]
MLSRLLARPKFYDALILLGLLAVAAALVRFPREAVQAASDGVALSFNVIVPSLFPFFVLSTLMVRLGLTQYFGRVLDPVMRPLFNVGGVCSSAFVLGFVGGYPVGAKTAVSLYENGQISRVEAERLLAFSNNSGPAFILGVVGVGIFASSRVGLMLYAAHALASVLVGVLFRRWGLRGNAERRIKNAELKGGGQIRAVRFGQVFVESVTKSFQATLNICGFVIFFTVFIRLLFLAGVIPAVAGLLGGVFAELGFDAEWASMLLIGLIELSSGVWGLRDVAGQMSSAIAMAAFMLGWAGLSVHCQVLSFIGGSGLSVRSYILGKFLHGGISAGLIFLLTRLVPTGTTVAATLAEGVYGIAGTDFSTSIRISSLSALGLWLGVMAVCMVSTKRARQKRINSV